MLAQSVKAVLLAMMRELAHRRHDTPPTRGDSAADGERPRDTRPAAESPTQAHVARRSGCLPGGESAQHTVQLGSALPRARRPRQGLASTR
jgi:hypothetical protein